MSTGDLSLWRAADEIFDRLLDLPADEREAALAAMALDPVLEAHVRRLVAAHDRADGPLDPAGPDAELEGRCIGRWVLEDEIGRGGMSVVYRARTDEGGETRVAAIKLLTLGALVAGGVQRFKREQAILARLQHPHIAGLLDCGVTEDGTPWLAMPLVDGQPIDQWCDERNLGVGARVQLMLDVCDAVAYAHRNLVIHRDIKPSNVLVDREGYVRLLDFGIGGMLESRQAGMTLTRMLAWTPQYAAPEQFKLAPASTAMDVYGLGALLYRLLTGRPPREGPPDGQPVTLPSRACLDDDTATAPLRRAASKALRGDLDAIVLKALAPDPEDRYRSPDALARDLGNWLRDRPVRARGSGTFYRLRCFLRRHRAGVAGGIVLALVLGGGLAATLWQAERARAEAARATAVKDFLVELFESADPEVEAGRVPDTLTVLSRGAGRVHRELAGEPALAAELLHTIGRVQLHLGDYAASREQLLAAYELGRRHKLPAPARGRTLLQLGVLGIETGRYDDARDWLLRARDTLAGLKDAESRSALAYVHMYLGSVATSLGEHETALAELAQAEAIESTLEPDGRRRGHLRIHQAQSLRAAGRAREAWDVLREAVDRIPEPGIADLPLLTALGSVAGDLGRHEEAERYFRRVVETMRAAYPPGSPALATPLNNLSLAISARGRHREAEPVLREALALRRASVGSDSARLAPVLSSHGTMLLRLGRADEAVAAFDEALAAAEAGLGPLHERSLMVLSFKCQAQALAGRADETAACESQLLARLPRRAAMPGARQAADDNLRRLALARLLLGQPGPALALLGRMSPAPETDAPDRARLQAEAWRLLAHALQGLSEPAAAAALAAHLPALADGSFEQADLRLALAAQARVSGDVATSEARLRELRTPFLEGEVPARVESMAARVRNLAPHPVKDGIDPRQRTGKR